MKVNGILIGIKRNNVKNTSRRRIQTLIEMQNDSDRIEKLRNPIEKNVCKTPQDWQEIEFNSPNPKGSAPPPFQITQDNEEEPTIWRSRRVQQLEPIRMQLPMNTVAISQDAVYVVLGNTFLADVPHTIPTQLQDSKFMFSSPMDIEE